MSAPQSSVEDVYTQLVDANAVCARWRCTFLDCTIEIESNSRVLIERLERYFGEFPSSGAVPEICITAIEAEPADLDRQFTIHPPGPGKTRIKEEFAELFDGRVVRKLATGMLFVFGGTRHLAYGPCTANVNQIVNFVNNRFIARLLQRGHLLCHAAGVTTDGTKGLAVAGHSGAGKSTLALRLLADGLGFVSNDRLLLKQEGQALAMAGVAKLPRVNPGTIIHNQSLMSLIPLDERERLERLPAEELWKLESKYDVFLDECFGPGRFLLKSAVHSIILLGWSRTQAPFEVHRIDPLAQPERLTVLQKSPGVFGPLQATGSAIGLEVYAKTLAACRVFEFRGGIDFDAAARTCLQILMDNDTTTSLQWCQQRAVPPMEIGADGKHKTANG